MTDERKTRIVVAVCTAVIGFTIWLGVYITQQLDANMRAACSKIPHAVVYGDGCFLPANPQRCKAGLFVNGAYINGICHERIRIAQ